MKSDLSERIALLTTLGLSHSEAQIYETLLSKGEMAARNIEIETGFKKNTYQILRRLLQKHLVIKLNRDSRVYYLPASPEELRTLMAERLRQERMKVGELLANMPNLLRQYEVSVGQPTLSYVESAEELRELYLKLYEELEGETYGCLDLEKMKQAIPELMDEKLIPKRNERKSRAFAVLADNEDGRMTASRDEEEGRISILLDSKKYPLPAEISVYGDKVVLMTFARGRAKGFVIRDPDMVESLRSIYRYLFDQRK